MVAISAFQACKIGDIETVRRLPKIDESLVDGNGASCLHYAARGGSLAVVEYLVKSLGFSLSARTKTGATALHDAAARGNTAVVKWLIEKGGLNVNDQDGVGVTALHLAARYCHFLTVEWLLDEASADASVRSHEGALPLHFAVVGGDMNCVKILMDENPRLVNMQMNNGATPIYLASQAGHLDILKYLVDHKGATKIKAYDAMSCLHAAAQVGHLDVVKWLVKEEKCNPNDRDFDGATPLHFAASRGHAGVVRWLLKEGGARVTLDNLGGSPLHSAAELGELQSIQALLDCGCDVTYTDNEGLTAAELANKCDQTEAADLIRGEVTLAQLGITYLENNHSQPSQSSQHNSHPKPSGTHHKLAPHSTKTQTTYPPSSSSLPPPSVTARPYPGGSTSFISGSPLSPTTHAHEEENDGLADSSLDKPPVRRTFSRVSVDSSASNFGVFEQQDARVVHTVIAEIHKTPQTVPQTPRPVNFQTVSGHSSLNSTQESIVFNTSGSSLSQDEFSPDTDKKSVVQKTIRFFAGTGEKGTSEIHCKQLQNSSSSQATASGVRDSVSSDLPTSSAVSYLPKPPDSSHNPNISSQPAVNSQDPVAEVAKFQYYSTPYRKDFNTVTKSSFARAKALFQYSRVDGSQICPDSGEVCTRSEREYYQLNQRSSSSKMEVQQAAKPEDKPESSGGSVAPSSSSSYPPQSVKSVISIHGGQATILSTGGKPDSKDGQPVTTSALSPSGKRAVSPTAQRQIDSASGPLQMQKDSMMKELQQRSKNSEQSSSASAAPLVNGHVNTEPVSSNHTGHKANPSTLHLAVNGGGEKAANKSMNAGSYSRSSSESSTSSQTFSPVESKQNLIADIQYAVSGASSLSLRRTKSKGEGVSMVYQSKRGASVHGEVKNDHVPLSGQFDPKNFIDNVEKVDASGRVIPEWRRQVLARHLAEKAQKEFEDKKSVDDYEARFKDMPVWKRALIERREAQVREEETASNKK